MIALLQLFDGSLKNVKVYGYVREELPRPCNIFNSVVTELGGSFRRMSCFAMDFSSYKSSLEELGITNTTLFVHGDILVYSDYDLKYPDWYCSTGTLRFGTKVATDYVTLLNYVKQGNQWIIAKNKLEDFNAYEAFPSSLLDAIIGGKGLPPEIENLPIMRATLDNNELDTPLDTNLPLSSSKLNTEEQYENEKVSREDILPYNPVAEEFRSYLDDSLRRFNKTLESIKNKYSIFENNEYVTKLIVKLQSNLKSRATEKSVTGRSLIKKYLLSFGKSAEGKYRGVSLVNFIIDSFEEVKNFMLYCETPSFDKKALTLCKLAFSNAEEFYGGILKALLGIDFEHVVKRLNNLGISFSKLVNENPYLLFLCGFLSYRDAEYLAILFNRHEDNSLEMYRDLSLIHDYILHSDTNSTLYKLDDITNIGIKDRVISRSVSESMYTFFTDMRVTGYNSDGWDVYKGKKVLYLSKNQITNAVSEYLYSGMGVLLGESFTSTIFMTQELYIYETLYANKDNGLDIDTDEIDKAIDEYESIVGYKFEKEQRDGVHLIVKNASCLTGPAGSGKTSTVGCIVYVLNKLRDDIIIKFGSPTGKAAKVMQSVVKRPVQTLNALCKVGLGYDDVFVDDEDTSNESNTLYIFDEMSMVGVSLFYKVMKKLKGSRFMFIGDISQLKSISKGVLFRDLLSYLPCVYLKVSKRSSDTSGITYNSRVINEYSRPDNFMSFKQTKDFRVIPCSDVNIPTVVEEICSYYLGRSNSNKYDLPHLDVCKDDIQVISPITKGTYAWGTTNLNRRLQPLFNRPDDHTSVVIVNNIPLFKGDRVIHTRINAYNMQWYSSYENGNFQKIYGSGVVNGDIGKFVGVISCKDANFYEEINEKPEGFNYPSNLRKDSSFKDDEGYFIVVEYYDPMTDRPFYILYRCVLGSNGRFIGYDTSLLDLFYAGSAHKMQGSQSKIAICCVGTLSFNGFITRNMLYTLVTRGSDLVIVVGSLSQLDKSRREVDCKSLSVGELLTR